MLGQDTVGVIKHKVKMCFSSFPFWKSFTYVTKHTFPCSNTAFVIFGAALLSRQSVLLVMAWHCPGAGGRLGWRAGPGETQSPLVAALGWLVAAQWCAQTHRGQLKEALRWAITPLPLLELWDVLCPKPSYVGHNRTSGNNSNRLNSCGFSSVLLPCCFSCAVGAFLGGRDSEPVS